MVLDDSNKQLLRDMIAHGVEVPKDPKHRIDPAVAALSAVFSVVHDMVDATDHEIMEIVGNLCKENPSFQTAFDAFRESRDLKTSGRPLDFVG